MKPFLRWAGSKRKLLPILKQFVPAEYERYIEPFAGSACLFFDLEPHQAVISDRNEHLMDAYRVLAAKPKELIEAISLLPNSPHEYYRLREQDPQKLDDLQRACRFIYLNRYCFNGVYRTDRLGRFNVPRGKGTGNIPEEETFIKCAELLKKAILKTADFEEIIDSSREGDLIYVDPPYSTSDRPIYGEFGYGSFSCRDEARLSLVLRQAADRNVTVILSYKDSTDFWKMFPGWKAFPIKSRRHIAGFAQHRQIAIESIGTNRQESFWKAGNDGAGNRSCSN